MQRHDRRRDDAPPPWRGGAARQSHSSPISCLHSRISKPASRHAPFDGAHATSTPSPLHVWISWATPTRQLSLRILGLPHLSPPRRRRLQPASRICRSDRSEHSVEHRVYHPFNPLFRSPLPLFVFVSSPISPPRFCVAPFLHPLHFLPSSCIPLTTRSSSPSAASFVVAHLVALFSPAVGSSIYAYRRDVHEILYSLAVPHTSRDALSSDQPCIFDSTGMAIVPASLFSTTYFATDVFPPKRCDAVIHESGLQFRMRPRSRIGADRVHEVECVYRAPSSHEGQAAQLLRSINHLSVTRQSG